MKRAQSYWSGRVGRTMALGGTCLPLGLSNYGVCQQALALDKQLCHRALLTLSVLCSVCFLTLPTGAAQDQPAPPKEAQQQEIVNAEQKEQPAEAQQAEVADAVEVAEAEDDAVGNEEAAGDNGDIIIVEEAVVDPFGGNGVQDQQLWLLKAYVRVNSALARRVCDLGEAEEDALAQLNDDWLEQQRKKAVDSPVVGMAAGIARFLGGGAVVVQNANNPNSPDLIKKVKTKIDAAIDEALSQEHREALARERGTRDEFRKKAMAAVLVSTLDERLYLTQTQRDDLESGIADWLKQDLYWQFYAQNQAYVPDIPKAVLSKVLTATQLEALQGVQAYNYDMSNIEMQLMDQEPIVIAR